MKVWWEAVGRCGHVHVGMYTEHAAMARHVRSCVFPYRVVRSCTRGHVEQDVRVGVVGGRTSAKAGVCVNVCRWLPCSLKGTGQLHHEHVFLPAQLFFVHYTREAVVPCARKAT